MKKLLFLLLTIMSITTFAATVSIPDSLLTENQKAFLNTQTTISTWSQWIGLGKEVGIMVNDGLSALSDQSNKFAKTPVGQFTMFIILYKVMGMQLIRFLFGIMLFVTFTTITYRFFSFNYNVQKIRIKGNWIQALLGTAEYELKYPSDDKQESTLIATIISLIATTIVTALILFA